MILPVFKAGDRVTQRYQTGGSQRSRECEVVCVVQKGEFPSVALRSAGIAGEVAMYKPPRNHVSYVVRVGSKLYWPKVAGLRAVSGADDEGREREVSMACARASGAVFSYRNLLEDARLLSSEIDRLRGLLAGGSR